MLFGDDKSASLSSRHLKMGTPNQTELSWLKDQGVSCEAMMHRWPIGACNVRFDDRYFDLDEAGGRAFTIAVIDGGEIIDIAAWQPSTHQLASWLDNAFAIEQDAIFNPATYAFGGALHVHRTPIEWLRAGRRGIVILRPDLAHAYLAQRDRLAFEDESFARLVKRWIQPPRPRARLLVTKPAKPDEVLA